MKIEHKNGIILISKKYKQYTFMCGFHYVRLELAKEIFLKRYYETRKHHSRN